MTYIKSKISFQGQVEECNSILYLSHYYTKVFYFNVYVFQFYFSFKALELWFIGRYSEVTCIKTDQTNKIFVCIFCQYDLVQRVNSISQVGLNIDFSVAFDGC